MRGNRTLTGRRRCVCGSIPACAGEPRTLPLSGICAGVYPRVCGGTALRRTERRQALGLSPRVRGNLQRSGRGVGRSGSIPACAGEPCDCQQNPCQRGVYPRVCGGTYPIHTNATVPAGLSPRVRGNRRSRNPRGTVLGSIPACAGEPLPRLPAQYSRPVYPRVCGGTLKTNDGDTSMTGLSPRVRGNPRQH